MNTKGMKFLAVLAVLAMAFAAFAVINTVDDDDAAVSTELTIKSPGKSTADTGTITETGNTLSSTTVLQYYAAADVTIADVTADKAYTIYAKSGITVTITAITSGSVTIVPVTEAESQLTASGGITMTYTAATDATFTATSATAASIGGTATISAGNVPAGSKVTIAAAAKITVTGTLVNNGTIVNNIDDAVDSVDVDYQTHATKGFIVGGASAKITGAGTGLIEGTAGTQVYIDQGIVEYQTVSGGASTATYDGCYVIWFYNTTGTATLQHSTILEAAYNDAHGIDIGLSTGTVIVDDVKFGSYHDLALAAENLICYGVDGNANKPTLTVSNISIVGNLTIKANYAMIDNNTAGAKVAAKGSSTNAEIKVDSSVTSMRINADTTIADNITFPDGLMSRHGDVVSVADGKTLTANISNGVGKGQAAMKIILTNGASYAGTVTHEYTAGKFTVANFTVKADAADSQIYTVASTAGVNIKGTLEGTIGGNVTVKAGDALIIASGKTVNVSEGAFLDLTTSTLTGPGTLAIQKGAFINDANATKTADPDKAIITYAGDASTKVDDAATNEATKAAIDAATKSAVITVTAAAGEAQNIAVGTKDVALNITAGAAVTGLNFTVSTGGSLGINTVGNADAAYTGEVTLGTQKVTMTGVKGSFTLIPGSIEIDGVITAGTINLVKDDELVVKKTLSIDGAATINASGAAKIIIQKDAVATLGNTLTIGANITVDVYGKILKDVAGEISVAKAMNVYSGAVIDTTISGAGDFVVYSGADINGATIANGNAAKWTGKDAASGTWSITTEATKHTLTLNNYNGTYNFAPIKADIEYIVLIGDSSVTYDKYVAGGLFTGIKTIAPKSGTGSLAIEMDLSKYTAAELGAGFIAIGFGDAGAGVDSIDQATLTVIVKGNNPAWTPAQKEAAFVTAVNAANAFSLNNSMLTIDVQTTLGYTNASAFNADNTFTMVSSTVIITGNELAVNATGNTTVKNTASLIVDGGMSAANVSVSNSSVMDVDGAIEVGALTIATESTVNLVDAVVTANSTNNGTLNMTGKVIIANGVTLTNDATMTSSGSITVLGVLVNNKTFDNSGSISVNKEIAADMDDKVITITAPTTTGTTSAVLTGITDLDVNLVDPIGVAHVTATLSFVKANGAGVTAFGPFEGFEGTLTRNADGNGYVLSLTKDNATVTISYDSTKYAVEGSKIGKNYTVIMSGTITDGVDTKTLVAPAADTAVTADSVNDIKANTGAYFTTAKDATTTSTGSIYIASNAAEPVALVKSGGTLKGDVTAAFAVEIAGTYEGSITSTALVTVSGTMTGNITTTDNVVITKTLNGNVTADGTVSINAAAAKMTGNIVSKTNVTVLGELAGNIEITNSDVGASVTSTAGTINGDVTYKFEYAATKGSEVKTADSVVMKIAGSGTYVLNLVKPTDSTASEDGKVGYMTIMPNPTVVAKKTLDFTLTKGMMLVDNALTMPASSTIIIEKDTTFEVSVGQFIDVKAGALKASKEATVHMDLESVAVPTYGVVKFQMAFETSDGYKVYSDVASALKYTDEGATLEVGSDSVISTVVEVKKGVEIIVDSVVLTFDGANLTMGDGAKFTLRGTGNIVFSETGDNGEAGAKLVYYYVSANIEYDGNAIVFDKVRFDAAGANIAGIAQTETEPSKLNVTMAYSIGKATVAKGVVATTSTVLGNKTLAETQYAAELAVAADATLEATLLTDAAKNVHLDGDRKVTATNALATKVTIDGTLKAINAIIVNGQYDGTGKIILSETKTFTVKASGTTANADNDVDAIATITVVDTQETATGYALSAVKATNDIVITAGLDGTTKAMIVTGTYKTGEISGIGAAYINALTVNKGATFTADSVKVVTADSTVNGILKSKTAVTAATGLKLNYEGTYVDGDYTVYSVLANIDLTKAGVVTIEKEDYAFPATPITGSGTIIIKDGITATIAGAKAIIGNPVTTLGAGIVLKGTISVGDDKYLILYPDVDISEAKIIGAAAAKKAVTSVFDIEGSVYATVYSGEDTALVLENPAADLTPQITGYTFTAWKTYSGKDLDAAVIGTTGLSANLVAGKVTMTVVTVEGVTYYLNGIEFVKTDLATKFGVGDVITMKISDTSKYEGTPKIDGKTNYVVSGDSEGKTITATGVSPIPAPEPEPAAGMSLTEILLIVLVVLIAIMVVIIALRLNRS